MKLQFTMTHGSAASLRHITCDVLLLGIAGELNKHPLFDVLNANCEGMLASQAVDEEFTAEAGTTLIRHLPKLSPKAVIVFAPARVIS